MRPATGLPLSLARDRGFLLGVEKMGGIFKEVSVKRVSEWEKSKFGRNVGNGCYKKIVEAKGLVVL